MITSCPLPQNEAERLNTLVSLQPEFTPLDGQFSAGANSYAGKRAGLYPEDDLQALFCDEVMGALEDINTKLGATFGLTGDALKHAREALTAEALPRYLRWLQNQLEAHGGEFFADHRLTVADLKVFVMLRWFSSGKLDHIPADLVEAVAPKLAAFVDRIAGTPAIAEYYELRGVS